MNIKLDKPIVFFDLETTGLNISEDRIIEIFLKKLNPDGSTDKYYSRVNPDGKAIGEGAQEKHGISLEKYLNGDQELYTPPSDKD